jgi:hypothetical protein
MILDEGLGHSEKFAFRYHDDIKGEEERKCQSFQRIIEKSQQYNMIRVYGKKYY